MHKGVALTNTLAGVYLESICDPKAHSGPSKRNPVKQ